MENWGGNCDNTKPESNMNDIEFDIAFIPHKLDNLKDPNTLENIKHVDAFDFVNFKLSKFDSIETIVNTKIS